MARYVLTEPAATDVREILDYLRTQSPAAAGRVRIELRAAMRRLADFPLLGHLRTDLTSEPLRFWSVYSYLIIYRPDSKPLQIIRVLHGARDVGNVLGGSETP